MAQGSKRVVGFGEAMVRLTPPRNERIERTQSLDLSPGGAELNTLVTVACFGHQVDYVTVLPDNPLGRWIVRSARAHNVGVNNVKMVPESAGRCGLYFLEEGTDPRPSAVVYDRANSALARITPGTFDWPAILKGAAAFHLCGITTAVSKGAREEAFAAVRAANKLGVPVFFDLNYRSKLWSEEEARACFVEIAPMADVMFASRGDLKTFFGFDGDHEQVLRQAREKLGLAACAMTRKKGKASRDMKMGALVMGKGNVMIESVWKEIEIVDRLGGGDAFAGGFISGYIEDSSDLERAVNLALTASALKHTVPGDFLCATRAEIEAAVGASDGGVLQR